MRKNIVFIAMITLILSGCAATEVAISKRNLDVQTKMSATVFLDPVVPKLQTVYVQIRNTSDEKMDLAAAVVSAISANGYRVVSNPNDAHYMLQASVLRVGKIDPSAAQKALLGGYGGALEGGALGVAVAAASNNTNALSYGGFGLIGAVGGAIANAVVKDVTYTMITDLQISTREAPGTTVQQQTNSKLVQGTSSQVIQKSTSDSVWKRYRTRIVSTAEKVNLSFKDARPELEHGLVHSIAGIF